MKYYFILLWLAVGAHKTYAQAYYVIHTQMQSIIQQNTNQATYFGNSATGESGWYNLYSGRNAFSSNFIDLRIYYTLLYKWEFANNICKVSVANYAHNAPELYMKHIKKISAEHLQWQLLGEVVLDEQANKLIQTWQQTFVPTSINNKNSFIAIYNQRLQQCYAVSDDKPYKMLLWWLQTTIKNTNGIDILQPLTHTPIIPEIWDKKTNSFKIYNYKNNYK